MGEEGGSVTLLCLTASSGVPLFCRSMGAPSKHQLPFSVIGSLNGVHMFGANLDVLLTAACTTNTHVVWRVFHNSITLIVLSSEEGVSDFALGRLLDNAFSAMVLILGLEELVNVRNIERLKKDLRACYKLIDSFLAPLERSGDLTQCVECVPVPHGAALQECLEAFVAAAESRFGCLVAGGRLALATEPWWQLAPQELLLLSWLVGSLPPHAARDYPIYLPHGSPTVSAQGEVEMCRLDGVGVVVGGLVRMGGCYGGLAGGLAATGERFGCQGGAEGLGWGARGLCLTMPPPRSPTGSSPASCCPAWRPA
uniref:Fuzzy planar cell polarity protein n=1 Tax=Chrysemys picta bellii TaxID=8478 RepID=A0A8C3FMQ0_CHRPI